MENGQDEGEGKAENAIECQAPEIDDHDDQILENEPQVELEQQKRLQAQQFHDQMMIKYWRSKSLPVATYPLAFLQKQGPSTADQNILIKISKDDPNSDGPELGPGHPNLELSTSNTSAG